jgi:Uma2 family endonuclease
MIEDPHLLEERRRRGADRWDEVWEGVLHMAPAPSRRHQFFGSELQAELRVLARARGLRVAHDMNLYRADDDYRIPDIVVYRLDQTSARGLEGAAELLVEIMPPQDESRVKLPWYAARDVREVLLIDRDSLAVELYACETGVPVRVEPAQSKVLDCTFTTVDSEHLEVAGPEGTVVVSP